MQKLPSFRPVRVWGTGLALAALSLLAGCASHSQKLIKVREALVRGEPEAALTEFAKQDEKESDLLYLLERAYLEHEAGKYDLSNQHFQAAETRAVDLYTKSISGELASLITSDNVLPYRGYAHELVMIHYYRAFNYLALGQYDGALVEARKANQRLTELSDKREDKDTYRDDAFMQYFTALLYDGDGEINDAVVSYRDAHRVFGEYSAMYGVSPPRTLESDFYNALTRLGSTDEADQLAADRAGFREEAAKARDANVVLFIESGFAPYLEPVDIILPIFESKDDDEFKSCSGCEAKYAGVLVNRYGSNIYAYQSGSDLDHILGFSFPQMIDYSSTVEWAEVTSPVKKLVPKEPVQPLSSIAHQAFNDKIPQMLLKTIARALVKEFARTRADKESELLGALVNIANLATERADTRTWFLLPGEIHMVKLALPPGPQTIEIALHSGDNAIVETRTVDIDVAAHGLTFARVRSYR